MGRAQVGLPDARMEATQAAHDAEATQAGFQLSLLCSLDLPALFRRNSCTHEH